MIPQAYPLFVITVENWDGYEFDVEGPDRVIGWHEIGGECHPVKTGPLGTGYSDAYEEGVTRRYHYFDDYDGAVAAKLALTEEQLKRQKDKLIGATP
jgi:hypothetical protein